MITEHDDDEKNLIPAEDVFASLGLSLDEPLSLGRHIRVTRHAEGWTLAEIASQLGCSPQRLSDYEHGRRLPSFTTALKMAQLFEYSKGYFIQLVIEEQLKREGLNLQEVGLYFSQAPKSSRKAKSS
jgi:transcriptional regulator with XRE-family HTH domain